MDGKRARESMAEEVKGVKKFEVSSSPHLKDSSSSRRIMYEVVIGLLPATAWAVYEFRGGAAGVLVSCVAACLATEWIFNRVRGLEQTAWDGSALVTAMILGLSLPAALPWWAAVIGSVVAIAIGKMVFGGLGANIFNPAMVGRAFLMACFGTMMTTWIAPAPEHVVPAAGEEVAAVTQATPLMELKAAKKESLENAVEATRMVDEVEEEVNELLVGKVPGSLGETSALLWMVGGVFLLVRRTITWHVPAGMLGGAMVLATAMWLYDGAVYPNPLVHLFAGGLMMGAFFIATDPVGCPLSRSGRLIFGAGCGVIVMLIRLWGGYPEGVMYAVLFMNAMTPLLERWTRPVPTGGHAKAG